jgi:lipoprotein-anchoring transpeptidase ErfK/SrfK
VTKAKDAEIQETADGYEIVPEEDGTELDEEKVYELVKDAVDAGETEVDLNASDCYKTAAVTSKNTKLRKKVKKLNDYFNEVITYNIGDNQVTLDYSTIREWMTMDDDLNVEFNWNMIADWMSDLSEKYHTFGTEMEFTTSLGETITVKHETYGWLIDQATEVDALLELLNNAESAERTPTYLESARAWDEDGNDIGDTYVEIDYTNQRMWFYKDGELLVDTPIVTGNSSKKYDSPEGIFCVFNKEEEAVLKGEDYKTPVDFWMPFYEGVGIHDSKWRSEYGGTIYKTSGSHGCINTPWEQAKIIYENISIGDPVICYKGATNQKKGTTTIPQPEETRVLDKDGNDITDQSESDKTEDDDDKEDDDDTPTVDIN